MADKLYDIITAWVKKAEKDSPHRQHSPGWKLAKVNTIGGSSISSIMKCNPYCDIFSLIYTKIGLTPFNGDIKTFWGNLFEDVIGAYVEIDKSCKVYGDDLFIRGPPGTNYSPDGITVLEVNGEHKIALLEYKCPYSRIPGNSPPKYYVPQVKMGLEIINICEIGLFVEAVFRRCSWDDLGNNLNYDKLLVDKTIGDKILAVGIIGFYSESIINELSRSYNDEYELGGSDNDYMSNDLGVSSPDLFKKIMQCFDEKKIKTFNGKVLIIDEKQDDNDLNEKINNELAKYTNLCREKKYYNYGILPWKLFHVKYKIIEKEENFLAPLLPKIETVLQVVKECNDPKNELIKYNIINKYIDKLQNL